jgi:TRAP-type transport system periplasmic protein
MRRKRGFTLLTAVLMVLAFSAASAPTDAKSAPAASKGKIVLRLGHGDDTANPTHALAAKFGELAAKYTNGQVEVQIFPNNSLGDEVTRFQGAQLGTVDLALGAMNNLQPMAASTGVFVMPYIFKTSDEAHKVIRAMMNDLNQRVIKESNTRILAIGEKGFRVLSNSKKPVKTINDLQGLRIRVPPNQQMIATYKAWGIDPVPMAWEETFNALQQKVVDGQDNPYATLITSKLVEVQKYVTEIHYYLWTGPITIGEVKFQSLPKDVQEALVKAGKEAQEYEWQFNADFDKGIMKQLKDKGMNLQGPPADEPEWEKRAKAIWPDLYSKVGGKDWVDRVEKFKSGK